MVLMPRLQYCERYRIPIHISYTLMMVKINTKYDLKSSNLSIKTVWCHWDIIKHKS